MRVPNRPLSPGRRFHHPVGPHGPEWTSRSRPTEAGDPLFCSKFDTIHPHKGGVCREIRARFVSKALYPVRRPGVREPPSSGFGYINNRLTWSLDAGFVEVTDYSWKGSEKEGKK
ncbi:hypothetical protein J6590_003285 [Homalodisca vitripennis]|nr:hypothetical protein J6590_003285 [Homalodisca vitripennis]